MPTPLKSLSSWDTLNSIPYYFFYYYVPTRYSDLSSESEDIRKELWNFKDGCYHDQFVDLMATKLRNTFGNTDFLTLVCIPASTVYSNRTRYKQFSHDLCSKLNMKNGFEHISIVKEKEPSHLGGRDEAIYEFDRTFFSGKKIVLFDDVVTRGSSMRSFIESLEDAGAEVVCCMSIGKTFWDKIMDYTVTNPWTGNAVFQCGEATEPDKDNRVYETPVSKPTDSHLRLKKIVQEASNHTNKPTKSVSKPTDSDLSQKKIIQEEINSTSRPKNSASTQGGLLWRSRHLKISEADNAALTKIILSKNKTKDVSSSITRPTISASKPTDSYVRKKITEESINSTYRPASSTSTSNSNSNSNESKLTFGQIVFIIVLIVIWLIF